MDFKDTFFSDKPGPALVMGILNVTPDSFYAGSRAISAGEIRARTSMMISQGADIIDVGAASSRPGAEDISAEIELERLSQALEIIREDYPDIPVSVDTFRARVAGEVVKRFRVDLINDISGGELDREMFPFIAEAGLPYVLMHMRGNPGNMASLAEYRDVVDEIGLYFGEKINRLNKLGIKDLVLDPGFGFAKSAVHNFQILARLESFGIFKLPVMVGLSRKSMIYRTLDTGPEEAGNGTTVLQTIALMKGARILRTHDVREAREAVILCGKTLESGG